jgi:hypothetical protein
VKLPRRGDEVQKNETAAPAILFICAPWATSDTACPVLLDAGSVQIYKLAIHLDGMWMVSGQAKHFRETEFS